MLHRYHEITLERLISSLLPCTEIPGAWFVATFTDPEDGSVGEIQSIELYASRDAAWRTARGEYVQNGCLADDILASLSNQQIAGFVKKVSEYEDVLKLAAHTLSNAIIQKTRSELDALI